MNGTMSWRVIVYAVLIFVAGLFSGVLISKPFARALLAPPAPAVVSQRILKHLQSDLSLTPEQTKHVKPLIDQMSSDLDTLRKSMMNQVSNRVTETNSRIAELLTPEQRPKFEKTKAEQRLKFEAEPQMRIQSAPTPLPP
jgi:hypothetical protein